MKTKNAFLAVIACITNLTLAQTSSSIDLNFGVGVKAQTIALGINRLHKIGKKEKLSLGYGVRYTGYSGKENEFITAAAEVSEGTIFKPQNEAKLDTLTMDGNVGSINAAIYINYALNDKWHIQFNIDAMGFSFGGEKTGTFMAESQNASQGNVQAKPSGTNLLLTGDYDRGSLNSEFFVGYQLKEKHRLKLWMSFVFNEYTTSNKLTFNNDRFRVKNLMPMIGYSYIL